MLGVLLEEAGYFIGQREHLAEELVDQATGYGNTRWHGRIVARKSCRGIDNSMCIVWELANKQARR